MHLTTLGKTAKYLLILFKVKSCNNQSYTQKSIIPYTTIFCIEVLRPSQSSSAMSGHNRRFFGINQNTDELIGFFQRQIYINELRTARF